MNRRKTAPDATDYRREAYSIWHASTMAATEMEQRGLRHTSMNLANDADYLESQEPAAHQPAGFIKLYPSQ